MLKVIIAIIISLVVIVRLMFIGKGVHELRVLLLVVVLMVSVVSGLMFGLNEVVIVKEQQVQEKFDNYSVEIQEEFGVEEVEVIEVRGDSEVKIIEVVIDGKKQEVLHKEVKENNVQKIVYELVD